MKWPLVALVLLTACARAPSDDRLRALLKGHEPELLELVRMAREDARFQRITCEYTRTVNGAIDDEKLRSRDVAFPNSARSEARLSAERRTAYCTRFRALEMYGGLDADKNGVLFFNYLSGLSISGVCKGVAYLDPEGVEELRKKGQVIQRPLDSIREHGDWYLHVEGSWYLFLRLT